MKRILTSLLLLCTLSAGAQTFDEHFNGSTLRLDYVLCGDTHNQAIYFHGALKGGDWAGRRQRLSEPALGGNGQIRLLDASNGEIIYANSFSTLFQEWQQTEEAAHVQKAFEASFLVPWPKHPVDVELTLLNTHGEVTSRIFHKIDPEDILIRPMPAQGGELISIRESGSLDKAIDLVIVAEGYTAGERDKFIHDAARADEALFGHEPFRSYADRFNVRAVFAPSQESGVSIPGKGEWRNTPTGAHFDTFYMDRYLTTSAMWTLYDVIGTVPFEHILLLCNTAKYGGGGIYNSILIMNSDHPTFVPVLVHEFGHSFGGLGDEYAYGDNPETSYPADTEPWEPNLTTLVDFSSKWADLVPEGTPIPTPLDEMESRGDVRKLWGTFTAEEKAALNLKVGLYEGGGYQTRGVYRPVQECRMRINECEEFCPVCSRSIVRIIEYFTSE